MGDTNAQYGAVGAAGAAGAASTSVTPGQPTAASTADSTPLDAALAPIDDLNVDLPADGLLPPMPTSPLGTALGGAASPLSSALHGAAPTAGTTPAAGTTSQTATSSAAAPAPPAASVAVSFGATAAAATPAAAPAGATSMPAPPAPAAPAAPAKALLPILRGTLSWKEDGRCVWSGEWAMRPTDTITSPFEYVSRKPAPIRGQASNGLFDGYFLLKTGPGPEQLTRIAEKGINVQFVQAPDGTINAQGNGKNNINTFKLRGVYDPATHSLNMTKEYPPAKAARRPAKKAKAKTPRVRKPTPKRVKAAAGAAGIDTPRTQRKRSLPSYLRDSIQSEPLSKPLQMCRKLLSTMMNHQWAGPFLVPVDYVKWNLPDYPDIIKQPMDFGTIKSYMAKGSYTDIHSFAKDMRLVFSNAILYNKPQSDVYEMACALLKQFEKKFEDLANRVASNTIRDQDLEIAIPEDTPTRRRRSGKTPSAKRSAYDEPAGSAPRSRKKARYSTPRRKPARAETDSAEVAMLRAQLEALTKQVVAMQSTGGTPRAARAPATLSVDEKRRLSEQINTLPSDKLDHVLEIISARMPELRNQDQDVEIDIDSLDNVTLLQLQSYVKSCTKRPKSKSRRSSHAGSGMTQDRVDFLDAQLKGLSGTLDFGSDAPDLGDGAGFF